MTTENLTGLDALVKANKAVADSARKRGQDVQEAAQDELRAQDERMADHAIAGRVMVQRHRDDMKVLNEEAGQMAFILNGTDNDSDDTPSPEPDPEPEVVDQDSDNGNPPTVVVPAVPEPEPQAQPRNNGDPKNWRGIAWFWALVGAVIGAIVARVTYDPMWENADNHDWHSVLVVLWFIVLIAAGFFSGGWFGATQEEKRQNN
jgi:hypothetical protein